MVSIRKAELSNSTLHVLRCRNEDARPLLTKIMPAPPLEIGCMSAQGDCRVFCLGPDEWQVLRPKTADVRLSSLLANRADGVSYSLVEVGDSRICFEVIGDGASEILSYGCPIDLAPTVFDVGRAVRTQFSGLPVVIGRVGPECFMMLTMRSHEPYVCKLLSFAVEEQEAASEDGEERQRLNSEVK